VKRPPHVRPPAHWTRSPPPPEPGGEPQFGPEAGGPKGLEPTRYNDWERKGIAWDF
jgi:hypothetical protein